MRRIHGARDPDWLTALSATRSNAIVLPAQAELNDEDTGMPWRESFAYESAPGAWHFRTTTSGEL